MCFCGSVFPREMPRGIFSVLLDHRHRTHEIFMLSYRLGVKIINNLLDILQVIGYINKNK